MVELRNKVTGFFYRNLLKPVFFRFDPEHVHDRMVAIGRVLGSNLVTRQAANLAFFYSHSKLRQEILGITFKNPIGLAAGFDKDARLTGILPEVGFGFAEIGSITGEPCGGNDKPRLWRLKQSKSLLVYYGLKNQGSETIAARLQNRTFRIPIGISIAKTNSVQTVAVADGIRDYVKAYRAFANIGSYTTINISCPNAFGGEPFTDPEKLELLLRETDAVETPKPVFIKLSPDLAEQQVDAILEVIARHRVHGIICSNLTKNRNNPKLLETGLPATGGISGKVVEHLANRLIAYTYKKTRGRYVVVGCGGVFNAADAYKKIRLGASLIQMITGMVFEGPQVISEINHGLVMLLQRDGFKNVAEAVGIDNR